MDEVIGGDVAPPQTGRMARSARSGKGLPAHRRSKRSDHVDQCACVGQNRVATSRQQLVANIKACARAVWARVRSTCCRCRCRCRCGCGCGCGCSGHARRCVTHTHHCNRVKRAPHRTQRAPGAALRIVQRRPFGPPGVRAQHLERQHMGRAHRHTPAAACAALQVDGGLGLAGGGGHGASI